MESLDNLARLKNGIKSKRFSSYDRTGGNEDYACINANESLTISDISGAGIIKHIWITHDYKQGDFARRNLILRMYWDGEEDPSVEAPLGDFFGNGFGEYYNFTSLPLACGPKRGHSFVSYFSMPFSNGARITVENATDNNLVLYYYVDYEEHESIPDDMGRFHAMFNKKLTEGQWPEYGENENSSLGEENYKKIINKSDEKNYMFADIEGKGHFVGVNYYVENPQGVWYGEGDDMFRIDGEEWPFSLHGTGTEDFFNAAWGPAEEYNHPYFGYAKVPGQHLGWLGKTHCYRFMINDPVYFDKSLYASIEHGHANVLGLDISSVAYWYQMEPHKKFKELPSKEERAPHEDTNDVTINRWRDAWIREMRDKGIKRPLWGNEWKEEK